MTSYQKRKREIAYLEQRVRDLSRKAEFFQKAIWSARKATGGNLGVRTFTDLGGDGELPILDKNGNVVRLVIIFLHKY